jgi:branched-chain amino acid transport system substrate-binding protein
MANSNYNIYLDADFSVHKESANAIKGGIESAIDFFFKENPNSNFKISLKSVDHRGNTRRSLANFKKILKDKQAIAVFGGLHSPPLITNNAFINNNKILTFVPWAAGGPITRSKVSENWIYRLSVDDAQAGGFIAKQAVIQNKCKRPFLVLEKTPWGKSNKKNMTKGLKEQGIKPYEIQLFGWGVSKSSSAEIAAQISKSGSDCIFFVGNGKDATTIFNAFGNQKLKLPIFSHWGLTGGSGKKMAKTINKNGLDVKIIQTKFTFLNKSLNEFQKNIKDSIMKKYNFKQKEEINPMSGWVHGFDLALIVLNSISRLEKVTQATLKKEIENLSKPIQGLIKNYKKPFKKFSSKDKNAHEALLASDYILRNFDSEGNLR